MTFDEAVLDPNRPLNISPSDWIAHLSQVQEAIEEYSVVTEELEDYSKSTDDENALVYLDSGLDLIVQGLEVMVKGLKLANRANLSPSQRKHIQSIEDNVNNAIIPYTSEIIDSVDSICDGE